MSEYLTSIKALVRGCIGYPETVRARVADVRAQVDISQHAAFAPFLDSLTYLYTEQIDAAEQAYNDAVKLVGPDDDENVRLLCAMLYGRILEKQGRYRDAIKVHQELEHLWLGADPYVAMVSRWKLGNYYRFCGQLTESYRYVYAARLEAMKLGPQKELATITSDLGNLHLESGDPAKALARYEESVHLMRSSGDQEQVDIRLVNVATALQRLNRHQEAEQLYHEILDRNTNTFTPRTRMQIETNLAIALKEQGKFDAAEALYCGLLARLDDVPIGKQHIYVHRGLAHLYEIREQFDEALSVLETVRELASNMDAPQLLFETEAQHAELLYDKGEEEESLRLLMSTFTSMKESSFTRLTLDIGRTLEKRLMERGAIADAYDVLTYCSELRERIYEAESERAVELGQVRIAMDTERRLLRTQEEQRRKLLHEVLPSDIANRLMEGERRIADRLDMAGILFADIVGFTHFAAEKSPDVVLQMLEDLFQAMDVIIQQHRCEKVKTIGDAYMATTGTTDDDSVDAIVRLARCGLDILDTLEHEDHSGVTLRIGMHAGPVVAGVMGGMRIAYDMWGDTVNLASRMESTSEPGRFQITQEVADALSGHQEFMVTPRSVLDVRGRGPMQTYWVERRPSHSNQ